MLDDKEVLLEILSNILGDPEKVYDSKLQYGYNCPECGVGQKKGNLEVSLDKHLFHCWSCGGINDTQGPLGKLIDRYGNKKQKKIYNLLRPEDLTVKEVKKPKIKLPESYVRIMDSSERYPVRRQAYAYLKNRGIGDNMIRKYQIGFCDKGSHMGRIIVPSFDKEGELNYYIARSWDPHSRAKYKNPDYEKDKIIFNESLINWKKDIFLVEGVFDGFFVDNSIPLLGKYMSDLLFNTIYEKARGEITIGLDGDAFKDAVKLYEQLNGGRLFGKIKILKLPNDKDICDLRGNINEYYYKMKH
jgi:DNA primase